MAREPWTDFNRTLTHGLTFWLVLRPWWHYRISVMNEWDLQAELTDSWLKEPPEIGPYGRLDLVAWELMFPSWDINYKTTRWNEPSLDFVFLTQADGFVLVELKNVIPNRSSFLSAFCQVSHRAVQFVRTYNPERLQKAFRFCMEGACQRPAGDPASLARVSDRIAGLPTNLQVDKVYRVIAATEFPTSHGSLLDQYNSSSFEDLVTLIGEPAKSAKERRRFCGLERADFDRFRSNPVFLQKVVAVRPTSVSSQTSD